MTDLFWSDGKAHPVFRFQTPDGRTFDVQGHLGTAPPMYRVGAAVRVLYDPANPEDARIDRAAFGAVRVVLLLLFGLAIAALTRAGYPICHRKGGRSSTSRGCGSGRP